MAHKPNIRVLIAALLICVGVVHSFGQTTPVDGPAEGRLLFTLDGNAESCSYVFSSDLRKVACVVKDDEKQCVAVNGVKQKLYDEVLFTSLTFSADGARLAYWAKRGDKWMVVCDGVEGRGHDGFRQGQVSALDRMTRQSSFMIWFATTLTFSPDGKRLAYNATRGKKCFLVLDGEEGPAYDGFGINCPVFGPDGRRTAYQAWRGKRAVVIVDGKEYGKWDAHWQRSVLFSPDSKRWATVVWEDKKPRILLDGVEGAAMTEIGECAFGPASEHFAYVCKTDDDRATVVVDGTPGALYDDVWCMQFGKNGSLAYFARRNGKQFLVLNGKEGQAHERAGGRGGMFRGASSPSFSPEGNRIAYVAFEKDTEAVVVDGTTGTSYMSVSEPLWSTDETHVAYVAVRTMGSTTAPSRVQTGSDREETEVVVIRGSEEYGPFDMAKGLTFSPDGRHLLFVATRNEKQYVAVNGLADRHWDVVPHGAEPQFVNNTTFVYLAVKGDKVYLVKQGLNDGG